MYRSNDCGKRNCENEGVQSYNLWLILNSLNRLAYLEKISVGIGQH